MINVSVVQTGQTAFRKIYCLRDLWLYEADVDVCHQPGTFMWLISTQETGN
jgi:hypothetical protein